MPEEEEREVTGKAVRRQRFKGFYINKLLVEWVSNSKCWMARKIMNLGLEKLNRLLQCKNHKTLLFIDLTPLTLKNITKMENTGIFPT